MKQTHKFGMYFTSTQAYVMDDFGNAILMNDDVFEQAIDFVCSGIGNGL